MGQLKAHLYSRGTSTPLPPEPKTADGRKVPHGFITDADGNLTPDPNVIIEPDPIEKLQAELEDLKAKHETLKEDLDNVKVDIDAVKVKTKNIL